VFRHRPGDRLRAESAASVAVLRVRLIRIAVWKYTSTGRRIASAKSATHHHSHRRREAVQLRHGILVSTSKEVPAASDQSCRHSPDGAAPLPIHRGIRRH